MGGTSSAACAAAATRPLPPGRSRDPIDGDVFVIIIAAYKPFYMAAAYHNHMHATLAGLFEDFEKHRLKLAIVCVALGMFPFIGPLLSFYIYVQSKYRTESRSRKMLRYGAIVAAIPLMLAVALLGGNLLSQAWLLGVLMGLSYLGMALSVVTSVFRKWVGWASTAADYVNTTATTGYATIFFIVSLIGMAAGSLFAGMAIAVASAVLWLSAYVVWFGEGRIAKAAAAVEGVLLTLMYVLFISHTAMPV